jgi:hypothetical protein
MENETGFSLDKALGSWRKDLQRSGTVTNEESRELESHLLDTFSTLCRRGLHEDEAFLIAKHRLGRAGDLATEFEKLNTIVVPGPSSVHWKIFAWSSFVLALFFFFLGCSSLEYGGARFHGRVPISDAINSALKSGIRPGAAPYFLPAIGFSAFLILAFFRTAKVRFWRIAIICIGLIIGASAIFQDIRHGVWSALFTSVPLYLVRVPLETIRVLTGHEDGEYFQDSLVLGPAIGWWLLLWLALLLREALAWAARAIRPQKIDLARA